MWQSRSAAEQESAFDACLTPSYESDRAIPLLRRPHLEATEAILAEARRRAVLPGKIVRSTKAG